MASQKISQLNSITGAQITASSDVLAVVNNNETKKITVSGLHSGSFSGSFQGDGTGITGVTGEWDGSHNGNASITGSLTVTSDVSSSGNLYAHRYIHIGDIAVLDYSLLSDTLRLGYNNNTIFVKIGRAGITTDGILLDTNVTASGNISGSATSTASFGTYLGDGSQLTGVTSEWDGTLNGDAEITGSLILSGSNIDLNVLGNITASGDISSSGDIYATDLELDDPTEASINMYQAGVQNIKITSRGNQATYFNAGKVAIGTDTPSSEQLTVSGSISSSGDISGLTGSFSVLATGGLENTLPPGILVISTTTPTTVLTIPTANEKSYTVTATIIGTTGTGGDAVGGQLIGVFNNNGGTVSLIGTQQRYIEEDAPGSPSFDFSVSGGDILIQVTNGSAITYHWRVFAKYISISGGF